MKKTTNTMKAILGGVWRLGRGTATVMGLAVLLALTVGAASSALAGTGVGARFDLGKTNTVNAITELVDSVAGPGLQKHAPEPSRKRRSRQCQTNHPRQETRRCTRSWTP